MYLSDLVNRGNIPVLEKLMAYSEARHHVLAANIANLGTPGYQARQLDPAVFQRALRRAIDRRGDDPRKRLELDNHDQFQAGPGGALSVSPSTEPAENILFHDRTQASVELQMSRLAENVMAYRMASELLQGSYDGLKTAIRGSI